MNKIWLSGDAVVDLIANSETTYLKCPGGAPANVAVATSRLGADSAFFGRVGNDPLGRFMQQTLESEQVDTSYLQLDNEQRTSTVIVDLDDDGERSFTFMVKPSADQFLQPNDIPSFLAGQWLHICSIALANEPSRSSTFLAMSEIKAAGGYVSFDPNLREEVWSKPEEIKTEVLKAVAMADVVKFSDDELLYLTDSESLQQGIDNIAQYHIPVMLITQGAKGALLVHDSQQQLISSQAVKPVDTTGAGDAFVGGLLARLSQSQQWQQRDNIIDAIKWANGCGALATTKKGAMTALPNKQQLLDYISA